ncbi:MmcQ/YjbR family DNA-binding protein [Ihubacter sp. rT4E-8]|uniref:MmcQ/YjbR family DNA-binding protein n=1 Tax=Ihubacter sp. rT4E-8 TaxID=3242369 RepID=UPI003CEACE38
MTREELLQYVKETYDTDPEYLWMKTPNFAVLRHKGSRKWYGILMDLPRKTMGLSGEGIIDILNVKCDSGMIFSLLDQDGFFPAYHMNKQHWISIALSGVVPESEIRVLLSASYEMTEAALK